MFVLAEEACNSSVFDGSCAMCNQFTGEWVIKTNYTQMASKGCGNGTTLLSDMLLYRHSKSHAFCLSLTQIQLLSRIHANLFCSNTLPQILLFSMILPSLLERFIMLTSSNYHAV